MTVAEMMQRMDAREFAEWMAFFQLEPWGATRDDMRALYVAGMCVAPYLKSGKPPVAGDYFGHLKRTSPRQSVESMIAFARGWSTAKGGVVIDGKSGRRKSRTATLSVAD